MWYFHEESFSLARGVMKKKGGVNIDAPSWEIPRTPIAYVTSRHGVARAGEAANAASVGAGSQGTGLDKNREREIYLTRVCVHVHTTSKNQL